MTTVTLVQAAAHDANAIISMKAQPMGVVLQNLRGGAIQFQCTNLLPSVAAAKSVDIVFDGSVGGGHQTVQVSSVLS